ncbi:glucan endo-1,3-beta-glucosidase GII [Brachypodium distachyon]|uniref:Uncharacterized protein n=1 Tax=Brachypodium distachyon TaxID=15368 RepID=I1HV49_BRADI|nr:glucan endo-1,3-beta-glucosidase GII [Brachypodium distachyon]KQK11504.1 hypothetical protein BRADI_2g60542v3 [Brachypodium distachyon]|eukprot:XP_010232805.1 glucan endo-1,3-beta-glucosidase GII [Brachypodium distachyon]
MAAASGQRASALAVALLVAGILASLPTEVRSIGVCYGVNGDNLPSPADVVALYKSKNIAGMRIYAPDEATLKALSGTGIELVMDVGGSLAALASDPAAATAWVAANVKPFVPGVKIKYIAAGNEVEGDATASIVPAMTNLNAALAAAGVSGVKVSTAVKTSVLGTSSPPSGGVFKDAYMAEVVRLLASTGAPLLANVYPYFAYAGSQGSIDLNFALFQPSSTSVPDNGLTYTNLFDAMVDAMYSAMEKCGGPTVPIVVSESGWPSAGGGPETTVDNARTYNQNLIGHVGNGTPKRPGTPLETYIFAMFNENLKGGAETEKHFGLFNGGPDKAPAYPMTF